MSPAHPQWQRQKQKQPSNPAMQSTHSIPAHYTFHETPSVESSDRRDLVGLPLPTLLHAGVREEDPEADRHSGHHHDDGPDDGLVEVLALLLGGGVVDDLAGGQGGEGEGGGSGHCCGGVVGVGEVLFIEVVVVVVMVPVMIYELFVFVRVAVWVLVVRDEDIDRMDGEHGLYILQALFRDNAAILCELCCDIHK